ncbi:BMP family lipoprotein [Stomatohabitans albus]|uniref:BMP family lipoprotein n=1 Tax=Stomatohabitans albus TaxID=3110766 RepID=UPI00300C270B
MKRFLKVLLGVVLVILVLGAVAIGFALVAGTGGTEPDPGSETSSEVAAESESAKPTDVATGEATIAKVRIALNGKEETRQDFRAIEDAAKDLRNEHYDVKVFDHDAINSDHWQTTLRSIAASDAEFLVAGTGQLAPWILEAAKVTPDKYWITWDTDIELPNVTNIRFDNQRGAWLAGRVAGLATVDTELFPQSANPDARIVGIVAAYPGADSDAYVNGFRDGAKSVRGDMDVRVIYTNGIEDATQANNAANQLYTDGAQVVFSLLGKGNEGVLAAARTHRKQVITVGTEDTKAPKEPVIATLVRPLRRELVDLITSNNPQYQRTVSVGVGQDDVYLEVRPDLNTKVAEAVDDQIEAWEKEDEKK